MNPRHYNPITFLQLILRYIRASLWNTLLQVLLIITGMGIITALLLFQHQLQQRLVHDARDIDAVIGAKGSPLQLVLSSVQHIDIPNGNIPYDAVEHFAHHKLIKQVIPLAFGDTVKGYRLVGTTPAYITLFKGQFQQGHLWHEPMQAVLGATAAKQLSLHLGDTFVASHGLEVSPDIHKNNVFTVVGILQPTGSVMDRLVLTPLESIWAMHENHHHAKADDHAQKQKSKHEHEHENLQHQNHDITAAFVIYAQRSASLSFPSYINTQTAWQAASPAFEITRLLQIIGIGKYTGFVIGSTCVGFAFLGICISLITAYRQRHIDFAIMRVMGIKKRTLFFLMLSEGGVIALISSLTGILLGHLIISWLGSHHETSIALGLQGFIWLPELVLTWIFFMCGAVLACLLPAWKAYHVSVHTILGQNN